ncbi:MAG: Pycsar system effector family protein [Gammaproteobacteria bacterium]
MTEPLEPVSDPPAQPATAAGKPARQGPKKPGSSRGIETLFRVTYQNHIQLSQLADGKANTLISINGVIISIVIAVVSPQLDTLGQVVAPALALLVGCTVSLTFAVIASRPRLSKADEQAGARGADDLNLLFFGEFTRMSTEDFRRAMRDVMADRDQVYDNMIKQLHSMGHVLEQKYKRLQIAYSSFLTTLILSVALFVRAFLSPGA